MNYAHGHDRFLELCKFYSVVNNRLPPDWITVASYSFCFPSFSSVLWMAHWSPDVSRRFFFVDKWEVSRGFDVDFQFCGFHLNHFLTNWIRFNLTWLPFPGKPDRIEYSCGADLTRIANFNLTIFGVELYDSELSVSNSDAMFKCDSFIEDESVSEFVVHLLPGLDWWKDGKLKNVYSSEYKWTRE